MQIIIGMAGAGSRFSKAGYTVPKPLCRVGNTTMIQKAVNSLNIKGRYIFVVLHQHLQEQQVMLHMQIQLLQLVML